MCGDVGRGEDADGPQGRGSGHQARPAAQRHTEVSYREQEEEEEVTARLG